MESWPTCTSSSLINDYASHDDQCLPPGFRFHPTDEELVTYYLAKKVENANFMCRAVAEADLNKSEPWDLPEKAQMGEKEWYFYSARDRKYPTGMRTNRATESGYWKATGKDREVVSSSGGGRLVGMKKTLVFYEGRAPKGLKTNWVMHEYRAELRAINTKARGPSSHSKDDWVVCRIFHKSAAGKKMGLSELRQNSHRFSGAADVYATSLPALLDSPAPAASSGGSGAQLRAEESLMLKAILQQQCYNGPLDSSVKVEPAAAAAPTAFGITPAPPRGLLLPHDFGHSLLQDNAGILNTMPPPPPLPPPPSQFQYRTHHHFHSSTVTNTAAFDLPAPAAATIAQQPLSAAADHQPSNSSPIMINNISLAPLSRFPSDLESLWFYNDNL